MITNENKIKEAGTDNIIAIIGQYVKLDKKGKGLCPFHNEKSPSFNVNEKKGMYKCFGCGVGGDVIQFVKEYNGLNYPQTLEYIAEKTGIAIEEERDESLSVKQVEERDQAKARINQMFKMNLDVLIAYQSQYWDKKHDDDDVIDIDGRGFKYSTLRKFGICITPTKSSFLLEIASMKGWNKQLMKELGIMREYDGRFYDSYHSRILFPITNTRDQILGFTARILKEKESKKIPKYVNSSDSNIYHKDSILYGINQNFRQIKSTKSVILVEGNVDVLTLSDIGVDNVLASCGTAFTKGHVEQLKKLGIQEATLFFDGDSAGIDATLKAIPMLLEADIYVKVIEIPNGSDDEGNIVTEDPDSYIRKHIKTAKGFETFKDSHIKDGIIWTLSQHIGGGGIDRREHCVNIGAGLLSYIQSDTKRNLIIDEMRKFLQVGKSFIVDKMKEEIEKRINPNEKKNRLTPAQEEDVREYGFYEEGNCYYGMIGGTGKRISNFTIKPLFLIRSQTKPKRLISITNQYGKTELLSLPVEGLSKLDACRVLVASVGNFIFEGQAVEWMRVLRKVYHMAEAYEVGVLGFNKAGFWAWANGIWNYDEGKWYPVDDNGIVEHDKQKYFLPAYSSAFVSQNPDDEDLYEDDKKYAFKPNGDISFRGWADQFHAVFGDNGKIGLLWYVSSIFKDIIFQEVKGFPLLGLIGVPSSGKSFMAEALMEMFGHGQASFNLNSGTNVAFFNQFKQQRNSPAWFEEYRDDIDTVRHQGLKAAYDGFSRQKGRKDDSRSIKDKVHNTIIVTGQQYPSTDPALFTRLLILSFHQDIFTDAQKEEGSKLMDQWRTKELPCITANIINNRDHFKTSFNAVYREQSKRLRDTFKGKNKINERIFSDWTMILATFKVMQDKISLPFTFDEVWSLVVAKVQEQGALFETTNELGIWWDQINYLISKGELIKDVDFTIEILGELRVELSRNDTDLISFDESKRVLFISFTKAIPLYQQSLRSQGSDSMKKSNLISHMKRLPSFIGKVKSKRFKSGKNVSCYAFDFNLLGVDLDCYSKGSEVEDTQEREDDKQDLPF